MGSLCAACWYCRRVWGKLFIIFKTKRVLYSLYFSLLQVNGGDLKTLKKGLSLYHSEIQLQSQFQDEVHNVRMAHKQSLFFTFTVHYSTLIKYLYSTDNLRNPISASAEKRASMFY